MENKILAKVNGREISQNDINFMFSNLNPQLASQFVGPEGEKRLLDEAINQNLLLSYAKNENIENEESFKTELEKMKENLLSQFAIRKVIEKIEVSEEEAKTFYSEHPEYFSTKEQVRASHILVSDEETAKDLYNKIKNGDDFNKLAKEFSTCPSSSIGGDLNYFGKGQMVPEFEEAAFLLNVDEISQPVKTQFGYHIIKLTDKKESSIQDFEIVKNSIIQNLTAQKQHDSFNSFIKDLKTKYTVEIF